MSYDLRNAKINNFQQGGVNLGSQIFNDNGSAQLPLEQAAELVRLVLDEAPSLLAHATVVHGELRRAQEEGASPDRGRIGAALANITAGLRAGSSALVLTEGIRALWASDGFSLTYPLHGSGHRCVALSGSGRVGQPLPRSGRPVALGEGAEWRVPSDS